jgi:hypothetical protein
MPKWLAVGLLGVALGPGVPARAAAACNRIDGLPFTIDTPGAWCLAGPLTMSQTSGNAITIASDYVVLDLGGLSLTDTSGDPQTRAIGIYAGNQRSITIRNGSVRGFRYGILIADSAGVSRDNVVASMRITAAQACGIAVTGSHCAIRGNLVHLTGGSGPFAVGISQAGADNVLKRNHVVSTRASGAGGYAAGIDLTHGRPRLVAGNGVLKVTGGTRNYGIRCGQPFAAFNVVQRAGTPFSLCADDSGGASGYPYPYPYPFPYPYPYPYPFGPRGAFRPSSMGLVMGGIAFAGLLGRLLKP